jgi:diaminobutyrate-2-oxoglutarate transaminase
MFAFEAADIEPDAVVMSKAVGGEYPIALVAYHERYDVWRPGVHAGTFRGNQIAMVAGTAVLELIRAKDLVGQAAAKGRYPESGLMELAAAFPVIGQVRGRGLMWGLEMVDPAAPADALGSRPADDERARAVERACPESGLIIESGGRHGAVLRLLSPLVVEYPELDEALDVLAKAITGTGGAR